MNPKEILESEKLKALLPDYGAGKDRRPAVFDRLRKDLRKAGSRPAASGWHERAAAGRGIPI